MPADLQTAPPPGDFGSDTPSRRQAALAAGAFAAAALALAGVLQLAIPYPYDADTAYHVAVARLLARQGILHAFPWTPFSWLSTHYADKELLFHLLLAPISGLGWVTAARIAGAVFGAGLLVVLWAILRAERVANSWLWALLPLAASGAFAFRFALVRPHLLGVALALFVSWAAVRRRLLPLAAGALLFPWCYVAWHTPLVLVSLAEAARLAAGKRASWRPLAAAVAGLALGVLLHPNRLELLRLFWIVNVDILFKTAWAGARGYELGQEFQPFGPADAARWLLLPALMAAAAVAGAWRKRCEEPEALGLALIAAAYGALAFRSGRFVEYFAPSAALALAVTLRGRVRGRAAPAAIFALALAFTAILGSVSVRGLTRRGDDVPSVYASFLRKAIPPGAQVFTCEWGLTGRLMLELPDRRFLVALDPVLFYERDPERYRLWYALPREGHPEAAALIRERFGARYVLCMSNPQWSPLLRRLSADRGVARLLKSPLWYLYDLEPPPERTAGLDVSQALTGTERPRIIPPPP